ncbi:MAG: hypothetical protein ACLQDY_29490 [Streptosporangiaceae bacterium]
MITEELENELRDMFARHAADITVPEQARRRLAARDYRPGRVRGRRAAAGAVGLAAAAAVAIAVPLSAGAPHRASSAAIRVDSYTFRLPADFRPGVPSACRDISIMAVPARDGSGASRRVGPVPSRPYKTAAARNGGCMALSITAPYRPTARSLDPDALTTRQPVRVGDHRGFMSGFASYSGSPGGKSRRAWVRILNVQLPVRGIRKRDLVLYAIGLPQRTLIKIAARGLR